MRRAGGVAWLREKVPERRKRYKGLEDGLADVTRDCFARFIAEAYEIVPAGRFVAVRWGTCRIRVNGRR